MLRPLEWVGSARKDLQRFPKGVREEIGYALYVAQLGGKADSAKPMKGLGSGVLEVIANDDGNTFRAVYTVRYRDAIYVLHCFQKKSKRGSKTPAADLKVLHARLQAVVERRRHEGEMA